MKYLIGIFLLYFTFNCYSQNNVILIIADDIGTDYCGFYEDFADTASLPNLRKLVKSGVRFTNAMSNPVCSPTRAGVLTGRYSFRTGVGDAVGATGSATLDTSEKTIPRLLKYYNKSINTANFGKWHLSMQTPTSNLKIPNLMGYDYYAGSFLGTLTSYTNWTKVTNGVSSTSTTYATTETANDAINWIKNQNSDPFFLWLAFNAPHTPFHLPPAGLHSYTTLTGTTTDINAKPKEYFKASLEALDHEIGRLIDSLSVLGKLNTTDIIFIGDNGNGTRSAQIANTARAKGTIYQYGVRVPFIISGPSVKNQGRISAALVNTTDLFPTIIELMGYKDWKSQISSSKPVDGQTIIPILTDEKIIVRPWAFTEIFKQITDANDGKAIRNLDYKLLKFDNGTEEFYHLSNDKEELTNLLTRTLNETESINYNYLCSEMTKLLNKTISCKSISEINESEINISYVKIYPNPANDFITIELAENISNELKLELFDAMGSLKKEFSCTKTTNIFVDTKDLESGIYTLKVSTPLQVQIQKFMILN